MNLFAATGCWVVESGFSRSIGVGEGWPEVEAPTTAQPRQPRQARELLREDRDHALKAVLVVHNENRPVHHSRIVRAPTTPRHPAPFLVDGFVPGVDGFRMDEWDVDGCGRFAERADVADRHGVLRSQHPRPRATAEGNCCGVYWDWRRLLGGSQAYGTVRLRCTSSMGCKRRCA